MGDVFKGDSAAPNLQVSTAQQLQALTHYLPGLMSVINQQIGPTESAQLRSQQAIAPAQAALQNRIYDSTVPNQQNLNASLYQQLSPIYSQTNASNELNNIQGAGGQATLAAQGLDRQINPEFYTQRANISNKLSDLLNNPISGSETAAIERANAGQQINNGTFNLPSNTQQLSSAINFGNAGRDRLGQALGMATQALPGLKNNVDTFGQATGRTGTQGGIAQNQLGMNQLPNLQNMGQSTFGTAGQFLGQIGNQQQNEQNINAGRRTVFDAVNQSYSAAGSGTSGAAACCFIFMEAYHGKLPWYVRSYRDLVYGVEPKIAKGYIRSAKVIVPLMKWSPIFREIINLTMVLPLTQYGAWYFKLDKTGLRYAPHKRFWFGFWKFLGSI